MEQFNGMQDGFGDKFETFDRALGTAGQANDERFADDRGQIARQNGVRKTLETFCAHQDPANLAADQDYIRQYEETVQLYYCLGSTFERLAHQSEALYFYEKVAKRDAKVLSDMEKHHQR